MNKKIILILIIIILLIVIGLFYIQNNQITESKGEDTMNENINNPVETEETSINISINGIDYIATLENNKTANEFINRLPFTITMDELNGNEKYYYFDESFPANSTNIGQIEAGDIMLYGDDCLVIFYETFTTSYAYTKIGKIDNPETLAETVGSNSVEVSFNK